MAAALAGADETVSLLLSKGANPDLTDVNEESALAFSIESQCHSTFSILAPRTKNIDKSLWSLLFVFQADRNPSTEELVKRVTHHNEVTCLESSSFLLKRAAEFGVASVVALLTKGLEGKTLLDPQANSIMTLAIMSDDAETVANVRNFTSVLTPEHIMLALQRGRADVLKLFSFDEEKPSVEAAKLRLKGEIVNETASIADRLPKSVEFSYEDEMVKLRPLLSESPVRYDDLLRALHVPPVHAEEECPRDCRQKEDCDRLRQVYFMVRLLVARMGDINPLFRLGPNRHPSIIGSMKEHTHVFFNNEVDVHISLNKVLNKKLHFDVVNQQIKANENLVVEGDHIKKYIRVDGSFDCEQYTLDFMSCLEQALKTIDISQGFKIGNNQHMFTMERPTTRYEPCLRCMLTTETGRPQVVRCRHRPDCEPHRDGVAECQDGCKNRCEFFSHERTCNCQEFTSPSLTITKIGVALHVKFAMKDSSFSFIDCDINIPTVPTCTKYDGDIFDVVYHLRRTKPVGWLEELRKLEDMCNGTIHRGVDSHQVKMRMIKRDLVLARQVYTIILKDLRLIFVLCYRVYSSTMRQLYVEGRNMSMFF